MGITDLGTQKRFLRRHTYPYRGSQTCALNTLT